ncbi:hypothetical protein RI367_003132 [Sorochytrium milnesiophthora]
MQVLIIGNGGREHALAWKLAQSNTVQRVFVAPGNAGTAACSAKVQNVDLGVTASAELVKFATENNVQLVVPGPEVPLVAGIADAFKKVGIPCFGPSKKAAQLEGSKAFSKSFMKRHHIPTAEYKTFTNYGDAVEYVKSVSHRVVLKASGLAAGKGVLIPSNTAEALAGLEAIMVKKEFGDAGAEVVIEEFLEGEELSVLAFSDGYTVVSMPAAQDHKRAHDGDQGPNTGGMGCYAPAPLATAGLMQEILDSILKATVNGMRRDGNPFVGILYAGLMITPAGPKVLEYNTRFGDPETQVLLPLMRDDVDLAQVMLACAEGRLDSVRIGFKDSYACAVIAAAGGYPGAYDKGKPITVGSLPSGVQVFHAGTASNGQAAITAGGRVLAITGTGESLEDAIKLAYRGVEQVKFDGMFFRRDIGHRALRYLQQPQHTTYADAGVSIDAGNLLVEKLKPIVKATKRAGSDSEIGGFGGLFDLRAAGYQDGETVLVSGTDGVGTKLKVASLVGKHDTIGIDLVAMNVNDVLVQGAEPLFFLDYYACGKLEVDVAKDVVAGIAAGCSESGCALVGGETAEMPSMYERGDYDLAGFVVGAVTRELLLPRTLEIKAGDVLLGLPSSGVHSNGYSLVRHIVTQSGLKYESACPFDGFSGKSLGEALLTPTRIYVKQLLPLVRKRLLKGMVHITGGGFTDNIPRVLPKDVGVELNAEQWPLLSVFKWLKKTGNVSCEEMARTFNCGLGMILIVSQENVVAAMAALAEQHENVYEVGRLVPKQGGQREQVVVLNAETAWR